MRARVPARPTWRASPARSTSLFQEQVPRVLDAAAARIARSKRCCANGAALDDTAADRRRTLVSRPACSPGIASIAASALLATHLPTDLRGRGADLGAGYGYSRPRSAARRIPASTRSICTKPMRVRWRWRASTSPAAATPARCRRSTGTTSRAACRAATISSSAIRPSTAAAHDRPELGQRLHRRRRREALQPRRPPVAGREPAPALRSRARAAFRSVRAWSRNATGSR